MNRRVITLMTVRSSAAGREWILTLYDLYFSVKPQRSLLLSSLTFHHGNMSPQSLLTVICKVETFVSVEPEPIRGHVRHPDAAHAVRLSSAPAP